MMDYYTLYTLPLALIGLLFLFVLILDPVWSLLQACRAILAPFFLPNEETTLVKKFGPWALITGSTDGIGKAYAFELAKRGVNIVLVSRSEERLKNTAREIESKFSIKTKTIAADFSLGYKAIEIVKEKLEKLPIDILVNNVGKMYDHLMPLTEVPETDLVEMININVGAVTMMCRILLEDMKTRGRGAVVNISSGSEMIPLPYATVYAATKAYMKSFSAALRYEYSSSGITIQHVSPWFVDTKMNAFSKRIPTYKLLVPTAEEYARYAVATLGKMDETSGYWSHEIQNFVIRIVPVWVRTYVSVFLTTVLRRDYFNEISVLDNSLNNKDTKVE